MTRHGWWLAIAASVVTAIAVAVAAFALTSRPTSDCTVVRSMLDYNNQFNQDTSARTDAKVETTESDYRQWAAQLRNLADQVHDADRNLGEHADDMADLADQLSTLVPRFRAESQASTPLENDPPQSLREYSRIGQEFDKTLIALDSACP